MSIQLRAYQGEGISLLRTAFTQYQRILFVLPTGGGKSVIFSEMARRAAEKGTITLILTDRIELFGQTSKHISRRNIEPQFISPEHTIFSPDAPITIGMVESVYNRIKNGKLAGYSPRFIVIDEAHKAAFFKIITAFPDAHIIGCTATPIHKDLYKYYQTIVTNIDIPELVEEGFLARCRPFQMQDDFSAVKMRGGDFDEAQLFAHFDKKRLYAGAIEQWRLKANGTKTLVFCVNIEHTIKTRDEFRASGINAEAVTSETSAKERKEVLAGHASGAFPVLINCGILTTGYDDPSLQTILINRATNSLALFLQMCGRGSRPIPGVKSEFTVIDMGMNFSRHGLWSEAREWTLGPPKKKKKKGPAPIKSCPKCSAMLAASARVCEFCKHEFMTKTQEERNGVLVEIQNNTPVVCVGKRISELTIEELILCQRAKRLGPHYIWRIVRGRGVEALSEYASRMEYKPQWLADQTERINDAAFKDYILQ